MRNNGMPLLTSTARTFHKNMAPIFGWVSGCLRFKLALARTLEGRRRNPWTKPSFSSARSSSSVFVRLTVVFARRLMGFVRQFLGFVRRFQGFVRRLRGFVRRGLTRGYQWKREGGGATWALPGLAQSSHLIFLSFYNSCCAPSSVAFLGCHLEGKLN